MRFLKEIEMTTKSIHRGAILHKVAKRNKKTILQITTDAGYEKSSFFKHIKQKDLPFYILHKYAIAVPYDFGIEIPEMAIYSAKNGIIEEQKQQSYEDLRNEKDKWKDKYYSLLTLMHGV